MPALSPKTRPDDKFAAVVSEVVKQSRFGLKKVNRYQNASPMFPFCCICSKSEAKFLFPVVA
jgi:hypothetical protein